ncbi:MAG: restriction endonuclease [Defluviitaleaceae bacterium]|nr:restriction endonuclease [Defluviitaleaceae bacterium]
MNIWTNKSIELANQRDYLDQLYRIYPMANNLKRELSNDYILEIQKYFDTKNNVELIKTLLKSELFPVKDSYIAYFKRDKSAIDRNPLQVDRIAGMVYEMGVYETINAMTLPKETNRQIGPLFRNWLKTKALGVELINNSEDFLNSKKNAVLNLGDSKLEEFAKTYIGYSNNKGLDFVAKFNNKIIIAETKFLTDFGGHQNAQFSDAIATLNNKLKKTDFEVIPIAILDGVLYIKSNSKMYKSLEEHDGIMSALFLRDFLYSL